MEAKTEDRTDFSVAFWHHQSTVHVSLSSGERVEFDTGERSESIAAICSTFPYCQRASGTFSPFNLLSFLVRGLEEVSICILNVISLSLVALSTTTVSYTHLDVYKRQCRGGRWLSG